MARLSFAIFSMLAQLGAAAIMVTSIAARNSSTEVKSNATRNPCESCQGWGCCCQTTCGQVGSGHIEYDIWSGTYWGGIENNGYGASVDYVKNAADQCSDTLKQYLKAPIAASKPCCLYTGQAGFDWGATHQSCNVLEEQPAVKALLEKPDEEGKPHKVTQCSHVPFPTNFWETLSQEWALYLTNNNNCHNKIFLLLPDVISFTVDELAKKISMRVELAALRKKTNINVITNNTCDDVHKRFCGSDKIRDVLEGQIVNCVRVPSVQVFKTIVPQTFEPGSSERGMGLETAHIDCHWWNERW